MNRLVLVKPSDVDGWYETTHRGERAYVMADFIKETKNPVPDNIVERMLYMVQPETGRSKSVYFNGYGGKWCHRFADWLAMNAGMPKQLIPDTSNCGKGIVWFATNELSGGFYFASMEHKSRLIRSYVNLRNQTEELTEVEQAYTPSPGDYVYFRWKRASRTVNVSHVGIVTAVDDTKIKTWEGNAGGKVDQREYSLSDIQVVGFGHPNYMSDISDSILSV